VAIADFNVIKDLLKREESNARQKLSPFQDFRPGGTTKGILDKDNSEGVPGIIFTRGKAWTDQRRFTLKVLKDFGFGKSSMEDTLVEEVDKFCKQIKKSIGIAVNPGLKMNISILNALWGMITGEKLPLDDPKLQNIVEKFNAFFTKSVFPSSSIASFFPYPPMIKWWIFTPFRNAIGFKLELLYTSVAAIAKLCEEQIEQHKENLDEGDVNDFIDAYLVEIKKNEKNAHSSFYKERGHYYLLNGMIDLFIAGMETTSASLTWTFLLLLHHPEIKRQLQKEIDTVQKPVTLYFTLEVGRGSSNRSFF
jgi:cytochrome P450